MNNKSRYGQRGVSADKSEVHAAIKNLDKGLFPNAFCKILPDAVAGSPDHVNIMHADTAGTKSSLAYIYWKETGDLSVWAGIAQDAIVMNIDDMACAGAADKFVLSSTIARNKNHIPGEVLKAVIDGTKSFADNMQDFGINIELAGGETADVGDIVRTIDVGYTAFARIKQEDVVAVNIRPGDVVVGLASFGQASYETVFNSGIGCNGLTSARHDVLTHFYADRYPESFDPSIPYDLAYCGTMQVTDPVEKYNTDVGKLLLSPTRTYTPVIKQLLQEMSPSIHGIIHNTGGAHSKVVKFLDGVKVVKDNLPPVPHVFELIQEQSQASWEEMYKVFNMGVRLEVYVPEEQAQQVIELAKEFDIDAWIIGHCEAAEKGSVEVKSDKGDFVYE